jgi:hypothetical protein
MSITPEFNKSIPAEVRMYGANAALVLALVRYATALASEHNGRLLIDGEMWWRGSHTEIGEATGLTVDQVQRAVHKLESAGALPLLSRSFGDSDQSKAYRVPDQPVREIAEVPTSQYAKSRNTSAKSRTPEREIADCSSNRRTKEEGEEARRAVQSPLLHVVADSRNAPTPQNSLSENNTNGHGSGKGYDFFGRPMYCPAHMPNDPGKSCFGCRDVRLENERLDGERSRAVFEEAKQLREKQAKEKKQRTYLADIDSPRGEFTGTDGGGPHG